jgi:hypothetical protein
LERTESYQNYLDILVKILKENGWQTECKRPSAESGADLEILRGDLNYVAALKVSSEGRRDRLIALLSQAILEARSVASASPDTPAPLAVIAAPSIPSSTAEELFDFRSRVAPDAAIGIFDREGLRRFVGSGLEALVAAPPRSARKKKLPMPEAANLFSDTNQWLLKIMLAPLISEDLLSAPRGEYRNAPELAKNAKVSVMSAFRFIRQLENDGFLDAESEFLRLVHREELLRRWQAACLRPMPETRLVWIDPANTEDQLPAALRAFNSQSPDGAPPGACLALTSAAKCLGFKPARKQPGFYLERPDHAVLERMGFVPDDAEFRPGYFVRQPVFPKSIFKATVTRDGIPVSDIIQTWLDISSPPRPDKALAEEIQRRMLAPIFAE